LLLDVSFGLLRSGFRVQRRCFERLDEIDALVVAVRIDLLAGIAADCPDGTATVPNALASFALTVNRIARVPLYFNSESASCWGR
jgi:hypothetical protein